MESPLGLGVVVGYPKLLSPFLIQEFLPYFTIYINVAVVGNIAMMVALPTGGTWRGVSSRVVCLALTAWLVDIVVHHPSSHIVTVSDSGHFLYHAVTLEWVLIHALYRTVMVTLPCFYSLKYMMLEMHSLGMMICLSWLDNHRWPLEAYFGLADTTVAASFSILSTLSVQHDGEVFALDKDHAGLLDAIGVAIHGILLSAIATVYKVKFG